MIFVFSLAFWGEIGIIRNIYAFHWRGRGIRADSDGPPVFYFAAPGGGINREGGILFGIDFTDQQFHQRDRLGSYHAVPAGWHGSLSHRPLRVPSGPQIRLYAAQHPGLSVPQDGQGLRRAEPHPLPGGVHRPGRDCGDGQHRRRHRGHLRRRTGGGLLDVGVRLLRHDDQVRRDRPGGEVPPGGRGRHPLRRPYVLY